MTINASKEYRCRVADELEKIANYIRENDSDFVVNLTHTGYLNKRNGSSSVETSIEGIDHKRCEFSVTLPLESGR